MLRIKDLHVSLQGKTIVSKASLDVGTPGVLSIVGPGGSGKSTLLHALVGARVELETSGQITFNDAPMSALAAGQVGWYPQHAVLGQADHHPVSLTARVQHSSDRLAQLQAFLATPRPLYVLDEPTSGLTDGDLESARALLRDAAANALLVMVTHNRGDSIALGGDAVIFAGGQVIEAGKADAVFTTPTTAAGQHYVRTGYVAVSPPARSVPVSGTWSLVQGFMYGMSRPGLIAEEEEQYRLLRDNGVRHLVCLEEQAHSDVALLERHGIAFHHVPVPDMKAPTLAQAEAFSALAVQTVLGGHAITFHCKGGLGRTGTALACALIALGDSADTAIAKVRGACPLAIQSEDQEVFIKEFASRDTGWPYPAAAAAT